MLALFLLGLLVLLVALLVTDTALSVWRQLGDTSPGLRIAYLAGVLLAALVAIWLSWRWLRPKQARPPGPKPAAPDSALLREGINASAAQGVDVGAALAELQEQQRRKLGGEVYIAVFGEVSTGKSSLVKALLPGAEAPADPRAGTTLALRHYHWTAPGGDQVIIADLPGFNLGDEPAVLQEARRAHIVVFLCDGDLTRSQAEQLQLLARFGKPVVVALNKADRYAPDELDAIRGRIAEVSGQQRGDIVPVSSGGREELVRQLSDQRSETLVRERPANVEALRRRLQRHLDQDMALMEALRDHSVLLLATEKLESARASHRDEKAAEIVGKYSKRAVVGALAAVTPGSDLVIQSVLATGMVRELCQLYGVAAKDMQIESFLKLAGSRLRKASALTLAIAGNALKAFPGVGTLTGGLLHAVAYGLIFDSLGRAAAQTLASRGELRPIPAAMAFEEVLRGNLESGAERFARLALRGEREPDTA